MCKRLKRNEKFCETCISFYSIHNNEEELYTALVNDRIVQLFLKIGGNHGKTNSFRNSCG